MRRLLGLAVALASAVILATGCGGGGKAFATGEWTATNQEFGAVKMDYRSDGKWLFRIEGDPIGTGTSTHGITIKFETDTTCEAVGAEQGTYT